MASSDSTAAATLRRLLTLAWPVVIARATQAVIGLADALMVAPLGQAELAAVTTGSLNAICILIFPMGTVFIAQSFASQLRGRGDWVAARRYAWYGLALALAAALISAVCIPVVPMGVSAFGLPPLVGDAMSTYLMIRMLSVGPGVATEALVNWYGGLGNTRLAMICGLVAMVANVALNYLLIEPRFGLPGYGVAGAAVASVLASFIGFLPVAYAFARGLGFERATTPVRLQLREFWRMLRFGLPNGVNWFLEFGAFVVFINLVVGYLGTASLAAFNVVMQLNSIAFMPAFGLSSAGAILVGEAIGAGHRDRVAQLVVLTAKVAAVWMGSVGLAYLLAPEFLLSFFQADAESSDFIRIGTQMLYYACLWQLFDALIMTFSEALRAAGDTTWPMWLRIILAWGLFTPGALIAVRSLGGGVPAVMASIILYVVLLSGLLVLRFASGRWKTIELVEPEIVAPT